MESTPAPNRLEASNAAGFGGGRARTVEILSNYLIWVAVAALVIVRQFMPRVVRAKGLLVWPLVMGYFGVQAVAQTPPETTLATTLFVANAAAAVVLGLARGASVRVWQRADGSWIQRGSLLTLGLWIASVGVRVALGLAGQASEGLNTITFFLALTFAAQNVIVWLRTDGARALSAVEVR